MWFDYVYGLLERELCQLLIASAFATVMRAQMCASRVEPSERFSRRSKPREQIHDFTARTKTSSFNPVDLFAVRSKSFPFFHDKVTYLI